MQCDLTAVPMIVAAHPTDTLKTEIKTLWAAFEHNRVELAPRLYELQTQLNKAGKKGEGFKAWLKEGGIPRSTAYRLIKEYLKPTTVSQVGQGSEAEKMDANDAFKMLSPLGGHDKVMGYAYHIINIGCHIQFTDEDNATVLELLQKHNVAHGEVIRWSKKQLRKHVEDQKKLQTAILEFSNHIAEQPAEGVIA